MMPGNSVSPARSLAIRFWRTSSLTLRRRNVAARDRGLQFSKGRRAGTQLTYRYYDACRRCRVRAHPFASRDAARVCPSRWRQARPREHHGRLRARHGAGQRRHRMRRAPVARRRAGRDSRRTRSSARPMRQVRSSARTADELARGGCRLPFRSGRRLTLFAAKESACRGSDEVLRTFPGGPCDYRDEARRSRRSRAPSSTSSAGPTRSSASVSARSISSGSTSSAPRRPRMATSASESEARWTLYRSWCRWPLPAPRPYCAFQVPQTRRPAPGHHQRVPAAGTPRRRPRRCLGGRPARRHDAAVRPGCRRRHFRPARSGGGHARQRIGSPMTEACTHNEHRPDILPTSTPRAHRIRDVIRPTPLLRHALLVEETGLDIWVKHENHNPTSAFKVRGGLNLVRSLGADERARGVVTASTGNHGQSIAMACSTSRRRCTVFVPDGNNPEKNAAMRALGAMVDEGGRDFDEARERCEQAARRDGCALCAFRQRAAAASPASRPMRSRSSKSCPTSTSSSCRSAAAAAPVATASCASRWAPRPGSSACRRQRPTHSPARGNRSTRVVGDSARHVCRGHGDACDLRSHVRISRSASSMTS